MKRAPYGTNMAFRKCMFEKYGTFRADLGRCGTMLLMGEDTEFGKRLISASADRSVKVWNPETGERLYSMSDATDGLNTVAVDPTGKLVAAGGYDKSIRIWTLGEKSATPKISLIAHEDAILRLAFSPAGKMLISTAADKSLRAFKADDLSGEQT